MKFSSWTQSTALAVLSMVGSSGVCDPIPYKTAAIGFKKPAPTSAAVTTTTVTAPEPEVVPVECAFGRKCMSAPDRSTNVWVSADLLYWGVNEDGFSCEFGTTLINTNIVDSIPTTAIVENDMDVNWDWKPGYRLGVGVDLPCSGWETGAFYTYYYGKGSESEGVNEASFRLHWNVADAVVGRNFWVGSCVGLKPFAGVRYAQISQTFDAHLESNLISATGTSVVVSNRLDKQTFWGFGPQLGLESDFYFGRGWSVYGTLDGAILYGHTRATFDDSDRFTLANNTCLATSNSSANQWVIDAGLGLSWEIKLLTLKAGLEQHTYFDFNQIGCGGNLSVYGANISAELHF